MSTINDLHDEQAELERDLELLRDELRDLEESYDDHKDAWEDWSIPESCGGGGNSTRANAALTRMNSLVDPMNKLKEEIATKSSRLFKVESAIQPYEEAEALRYCRIPAW